MRRFTDSFLPLTTVPVPGRCASWTTGPWRDEESLAEINEIFKVSGGSEMFDTIERHSDRKAREMGYDGADDEYMMDTYTKNSNEHY